MQTRPLHWMIRWPNTCIACYIGKFSDIGIGNIGISVAIGIIPNCGIKDSRSTSNLIVYAKLAIDDLAILMNERACAKGFCHTFLQDVILSRSCNLLMNSVNPVLETFAFNETDLDFHPPRTDPRMLARCHDT